MSEPEIKSHVFHVYMKKHDLGSRQNMRTKPDRAKFECFEECESTKYGAIRVHGVNKCKRTKPDRAKFECFEECESTEQSGFTE